MKGKYLSRGLKSAQACRGSNLTLPVKVVDMEQIKQKNEIDRANEQLKIEATKRQDLELRLRAEQLKQQEAQIKQQEAQIKQQEAQIKQREEDALRQKIQAEERAKIQAELEASKLKEELAKRSAAEKKNEIRTTPPSTKPVQQSSPTPPKPTGF